MSVYVDEGVHKEIPKYIMQKRKYVLKEYWKPEDTAPSVKGASPATSEQSEHQNKSGQGENII